ncbi:MAG: YbaN family protein [Novosphingobium sp.]
MPTARPLWLAGGIVSMALGLVGIALPIMPTVPFFLLAAWCFTRSRPEWAQWLYDHPRYGPGMREWRDRRAISRKAKISAILAMTAGVGFSWFAIGWPWAGISVAVLVICGTWLWTRAE